MAAPAPRFAAFWQAGWWLGVAALLLACLLPLPAPLLAPVAGFDKAEHLLAFALLAWGAQMAFAPGRPRGAALVLLLVLAPAIELLQSLTAWRSAEVADLLADLFGGLLGAWLGRGRCGQLLAVIEDRLWPCRG